MRSTRRRKAKADPARELRRIQLSKVLDGIKRIEEIERKCDRQLAKLAGVGHLDLRIVTLEKRIVELERFHAAARAGGFSAIAAPAAAATAAGGFSSILSHSVSTTLDREYSPDVDAIADELVAELFRNGQGNSAARLEQIDGDGRMQGGWGPGPFRDRVLVALRRASTAPAVLEAIQDEEAIERLALALRATSQWFTAAATAPQMMSKLAEFLEKPDYARSVVYPGGPRGRA